MGWERPTESLQQRSKNPSGGLRQGRPVQASASFDFEKGTGFQPHCPQPQDMRLEPLPRLSSPGFNPFVNPFWCFFDFTPALKPPVEDNGHMLPTPGVRGFYWKQNPDLSIRVEIGVGGYKIPCAD